MLRNAEIDYNRNDMATLSNYQDATIQRMHFDWSIDFGAKLLNGSVTHTIKMNKDNVQFIDLDSSKLRVLSVTINDANTNFKIADAHKALGNKLT